MKICKHEKSVKILMESAKNKNYQKEARYIRKVGARSQVTIPKDIIDGLQLKEGDQVSVVREKSYIIIEPVKIVPKDALYYSYQSDDQYITAGDIEEAAAEAEKDYRAGKLKKYSDPDAILKDHNWVAGDE
jgi:AbrB family looped-hinge helix DNA binding protein